MKSKRKFNFDFFYPLWKHVQLLSNKIQGHQSFNLVQLLSSCRAKQVALLSKQGHISLNFCTLASTILLLQQMEILTTQSICKEAPLATRLHTNKIEGFWGCLKRWMPKSGLTTYPRTQHLLLLLTLILTGLTNGILSWLQSTSQKKTTQQM